MPTLNWIGKEKVINHHLDVPYRTLQKQYTYNAINQDDNFESNNKIIHGDNLEALKSLLPEYEGRIDCIYIDPPYNTGNENWVYNDNVNHPKIQKWLGEVVGKESEDLTRHDKWLCMMYPRLKLLHKLLHKDGAIFISIDDNELANLKLLCDEIFGIKNFLGIITRKQSSGAKNDTANDKIITTADYILAYKKDSFQFSSYKIESTKKYNFKDSEGFFSLRALEMQGGGDTLKVRNKMGYSVYFNKDLNDIKIEFDYNLDNEKVYDFENEELVNKGYKCYRPRKRGDDFGIWRWGAETFIERFNRNLVYFDENRVYIKERQSDYIEKFPEAIIDGYLNTKGTNELKEIFNNKTFDFPKPSELLSFLFTVSTHKDSIILDSFGGSGTTAHAVLKLNKQDNGNRKFILVEMEEYAENITAERIKRVIKGYGEGKKTVEGTGGDFTYYELGEPLFIDDNILNENLPIEKLKEYVWFTETKTKYFKQEQEYFLGNLSNTAYYFYYDRNAITTLDDSFLRQIRVKAEQYIIYADNCLLDENLMRKYNIVFKKIPRDITKF